MNLTFLTSATLAAVVALAHVASAEPVTFAFTGRVTEIIVTGDPAVLDRFTELGVVDDASLWGEYVFEAATPPSRDSPGIYDGAILEARMQIGGWTVNGPSADAFSNSIRVGSTSYSLSVDVKDTPDVFPEPPPTTTLSIILFAADPPVFESTDLPAQPPDPSLFGSQLSRVSGHGDAAGRVQVEFEVESLSRIPDRVEEILGIRIRRDHVVFQVTSSGCTGKRDFDVAVFGGGDVVQVALIRTRPDACQHPKALGKKLRFSHAELGLEPGEEFVVINPRAPVVVP